MKHAFFEIAGSLSALFQNTHLNINFDGWPAAVAVIAISLTSVATFALKMLRPKATDVVLET